MSPIFLSVLVFLAGPADWRTEPPIPVPTVFPVQRPAAIGNRLYVLTDNASRLFEFDTATGRWTDKQAPLPQPRHHFAVVVFKGKMYTIGGCTGANENDKHEPVVTVEEYDPAVNRWRGITPMPHPRRNMVATVLNGKIYVIGGENLETKSLPVVVFDPVTNRWESKPHMIEAPRFGAAHAWNGKIYLAGDIGTAPDKPELVVREYDPASGAAPVRLPFRSRRGAFGAASAGRWLYLTGGAGTPTKQGLVERYDALRNVWEDVPDLPIDKFGVGVAMVGGRIFAVGGVAAGRPDVRVHSLPVDQR